MQKKPKKKTTPKTAPKTAPKTVAVVETERLDEIAKEAMNHGYGQAED